MSSEELNKILQRTLLQDSNCDALFNPLWTLGKKYYKRRLNQLKDEFKGPA
jgi:hypothetical protein